MIKRYNGYMNNFYSTSESTDVNSFCNDYSEININILYKLRY